MKHQPLQCLFATIVWILLSLPAFATWNGEAVLSGVSLQDVNQSTLSFKTEAGEEVPVTVKGEDDDRNVIVIIGAKGDSVPAGTFSMSGPAGNKKIDTPAAGPGQNIYIDTTGDGNASLQKPGRKPASNPDKYSMYFPDNRLSLSLGTINFKGSNIATAGTILPAGPGTEFASLYADYDITATGGTISYAHKLGGGLPAFIDRSGFSSNLTLGFEYSYYSGDENSSSDEPQNANQTGFLYTLLEPAPNDAAFENFGANVGIQSRAKIDVDYQSFDAFMEWLCGRPMPDDAFIKSRLSFGYSEWDVDLESLDTFEPTLPEADYFNHRVQSLDQSIFNIGLGLTLINPIGDSGQFDVYGGGIARIYYIDADLDSLERSNNGQITEDIRELSQSDSEFDLGLDLTLGLGWNIANSVRVTAEVGALLNVPSGSINNPVQGNNSNPGPEPLPLSNVDIDNENMWRAQLGMNYQF